GHRHVLAVKEVRCRDPHDVNIWIGAKLFDAVVAAAFVALLERLDCVRADVRRRYELGLGHPLDGRDDHCAADTQTRDAHLQRSRAAAGAALLSLCHAPSTEPYLMNRQRPTTKPGANGRRDRSVPRPTRKCQTINRLILPPLSDMSDPTAIKGEPTLMK